MFEAHHDLVGNVVNGMAKGMPAHVDRDGMMGAGRVGLLMAIRNYNSKLGAFEGYARIRIRGAVFDELRAMDWVPRSVSKQERATISYVALDEPDSANTTALQIPDPSLRHPIAVMEFHERLSVVKNFIAGLDARARKVIKWYFSDNYVMSEIARKLRLTQARVHQIIQHALNQCRQQLMETPLWSEITL